MKRMALFGAILALAACGSNGGGLSQQSSQTDSAATSTTGSTAATTQSTTRQSTTSASTAGETCVNQDPSTAVPPIPKLTDSKTSQPANYEFTVDYPSGWFDGTDMETVTAGGVFDNTTLQEAGVKPTDTLKNMNVAAKNNYPLLTVYRLPNVNDTADAIATRMASVLQAGGAETSPLQSWCLDGTPAKGFLALTSSGSLQESWFAIHGGSLYYVFFIGKTDGTQRTQDDLVLTFASIRVTWKWS